ncbi:MAG: glycerate kinase [Actinomycetota bacterium]|nr:glycerate kinase [Actinomycetota bacterium]
MRKSVVFAPDKFKGTLTAPEAAAALAEGWARVRPADLLHCLPMADGGDGTAMVLAQRLAGSRWVDVPAVDALGRPKTGRYLRAGELAVLDLAEICGIAGIDALAPMDSHTLGLGQVIRAAVEAGASKVLVGLGGSASTDGGLGAWLALGARATCRDGSVWTAGQSLLSLGTVQTEGLLRLPAGGVEVLVDVDSTLTGSCGAAQLFGAQKGASVEQRAELDAGLVRLVTLLGGDPAEPGAGAAGGTGYGLSCWGARLVAGAAAVSELIGLPSAIEQAELVVTGEGRFDDTSLTGKTCGHVLALAGWDRSYVVAGSVAPALAGDRVVSLAERAGSVAAAMADPRRWLAEASAAIAASLDSC